MGKTILIKGAGILGLWQALTLAKAGHEVLLFDHQEEPFEDATNKQASTQAGAMLAPWCEGEEAPDIVTKLGIDALPYWEKHSAPLVRQGTLVMAPPRDRNELERFASHTQNYEWADRQAIESLEPDLAGHCNRALFYPQESHMEPVAALESLLQAAKQAGVQIAFGTRADDSASFDLTIDCRGMGAKEDINSLGVEALKLRGVRGEFLIVQSDEIKLRRPVRLLHPRFPVYIVPWEENKYMIGATVIENASNSPAKVKSALDLLGAAWTVNPAFGEAQIVHIGVGVRPAFPDNIPKIIQAADTLFVNGAYRHGYLSAPALAQITLKWLEGSDLAEEKREGIWVAVDCQRETDQEQWHHA